ncbi:hypothetical protein WME98_50115 [Sorangium sp. So ce296]|uniref:hypothetical protein n=1 Tax=Sorangium sp. So ce296 TaxID=3133296 RepID=UPI003F61A691
MTEPSLAPPPDHSSTFADRCWWAYNCLPPDPNGRLPSRRSLEIKHELPLAVLSKLIRGSITSVDPETLPKLAAALRTSPDWLLRGEGPAPTPTRPVPKRPEIQGYSPSPHSVTETLRDERRRSGRLVIALDLAVRAGLYLGGIDDSDEDLRVLRGPLWATVLRYASFLPRKLVVSALELRDRSHVTHEDEVELARGMVDWANNELVAVKMDEHNRAKDDV